MVFEKFGSWSRCGIPHNVLLADISLRRHVFNTPPHRVTRSFPCVLYTFNFRTFII